MPTIRPLKNGLASSREKLCECSRPTSRRWRRKGGRERERGTLVVGRDTGGGGKESRESGSHGRG